MRAHELQHSPASAMNPPLNRADFEFELPAELIAQAPLEQRSASRLLALDGCSGALRDLRFKDLVELLQPGDLLVLNDTRVVPARAFGRKATGGRVELLLERCETQRSAWVQIRASKALRDAALIEMEGGARARVIGRDANLWLLEFSESALEYFMRWGYTPLPPYIARAPGAADAARYQTVYAREPGAVAAPTAGLHFDEALFAALERRGIGRAFVTLHVGSGTFAPVRDDDLSLHRMHEEFYSVPRETLCQIAAARRAGGRVIAVGTTVVRTLESAAIAAVTGGEPGVGLREGSASTRLFIRPGFVFKIVDALITNFHLPASTLLMLCSAFAGREHVMAAYRYAVQERYRFYSYGDAMWITPARAARPSSQEREA